MLGKVYVFIKDHLTKAIGALGSLLMTVAFLDPVAIRQGAQDYLGQHAAAKIGGALFAIVFLRGWYTGMKAKQAAEELAATQAALVAAHARLDAQTEVAVKASRATA